MIDVTYIDHMGSDLSVVNAARVSFGKKSEALGTSGVEGRPMTPILNDPDKRLIKYLSQAQAHVTLWSCLCILPCQGTHLCS